MNGMFQARKYRGRVNGAPRPKAKEFIPHDFKSTATLIGRKPKILLTEAAHDRIWHIVNQAEGEVGWLGTVSEIGPDLLIDEIFLFKQEANEFTNTLSQVGLAAVGMEILKRPNGRETWNRIRFWGHSHGELDTEPSGQDESQVMLFRKSQHPYMIRGIFNRLGKIQFSIFYFQANLRIDDVAWHVQRSVTEDFADEVKAELAEKVRLKAYAVKKGRKVRQANGNVLEANRFPGRPTSFMGGGSNPAFHWDEESSDGD